MKNLKEFNQSNKVSAARNIPKLHIPSHDIYSVQNSHYSSRNSKYSSSVEHSFHSDVSATTTKYVIQQKQGPITPKSNQNSDLNKRLLNDIYKLQKQIIHLKKQNAHLKIKQTQSAHNYNVLKTAYMEVRRKHQECQSFFQGMSQPPSIRDFNKISYDMIIGRNIQECQENQQDNFEQKIRVLQFQNCELRSQLEVLRSQLPNYCEGLDLQNIINRNDVFQKILVDTEEVPVKDKQQDNSKKIMSSNNRQNQLLKKVQELQNTIMKAQNRYSKLKDKYQKIKEFISQTQFSD